MIEDEPDLKEIAIHKRSNSLVVAVDVATQQIVAEASRRRYGDDWQLSYFRVNSGMMIHVGTIGGHLPEILQRHMVVALLKEAPL